MSKKFNAHSLDLSKREHHPFLGILKLSRFRKKQNAITGNRTRDGFAQRLDDLHYAIKSLDTTESNWILILFRMTETVIYFTICGNLVLSRKLKIHRKIFLLNFYKKKNI